MNNMLLKKVLTRKGKIEEVLTYGEKKFKERQY